VADWIAFIVVSGLAMWFAIGAIIGAISMAGLSGNAWYLLTALLPGSIAALLFWAAARIAPFSVLVTS